MISLLVGLGLCSKLSADIKPLRILKNSESLISNQSSEQLAIRSGLGFVEFISPYGEMTKRVKLGSLDLPLYVNSDGQVVCKPIERGTRNLNLKYVDDSYDYFYSGGHTFATYSFKTIRIWMEHFSIPYPTSVSAIAVSDDSRQIFVLNAMSKETHVSVFKFNFGEPWVESKIDIGGSIYASQFMNSGVWIDNDRILLSLRQSDLIKNWRDLELPILRLSRKNSKYEWNYLTILDLKTGKLRAIAKYPGSPFDLDANPVGGRLVLSPSKKTAYIKIFNDVFAVPCT